MLRRFTLTILVLLIAVPALAGGRFFYVRGCTPAVPTTVGETFRFYGTLIRPSGQYGFVGLIPLDFDNEQHTIVMEGEVSWAFEDVRFNTWDIRVDALRVHIFSDMGPASEADYPNPFSFQDGTDIASGLAAFWINANASPQIRFFGGQISVWDGGTRLGDVLSAPRLYGPDAFLGNPIDQAPPAGYAQCLEFLLGDQDFPVEGKTWSALKALYR